MSRRAWNALLDQPPQPLATYVGAPEDEDEDERAAATQVLEQIFEEYAG